MTSPKLPRVLIREERSFPPMNIVEVERGRLLTLLALDQVLVPQPGSLIDEAPGQPILGSPYVALRSSGEFAGHALYLAMDYEWVLGQDSEGAIVLVPLKVRYVFGDAEGTART